MKKILLIPLIATSYLATTAGAYAQNCYDLDNNPVWLQYFKEFNEQIQAGDNEAALKTTENLQKICNDSPLLNYAISRVYRNLGDHINEVKYLQRATDNAPKFNVREETLKKFWYARYEAEYPEKFVNQSQSEENSQTIRDLNEALEASRKQAADKEHASELMQVKLQYKEENVYKALMWSGAAIGIAGIALTATGGTLVALNKDDAVNHRGDTAKVKGIWGASWGILGAGIAAAIAGATITGYGGFHYVRKKNEKEPLSVNFGSNSIIISGTF